MTTSVINCHNVQLPNESLRSVTIWSNEDRRPSTSSYFVIRVGIGRGEDTDWLGQYDGSVDHLTARVTENLTGPSPVDRLLTEDEALVIEVTRNGSPSPGLVGLTIEWNLALVGGDSERPGALFSAGGFIPDARIRAAVESIPAQMNASGVSQWTIAVPLIDPDTAPVFDVQRSYTTTDKTFTAGAGVGATDVSITFTMPEGKTTGYAHVVVVSSVVGSAGGFATHSIYDGTTDHSSIPFTIAASDARAATTVYDGEITETTTFTYRVSATTANATLQESLISGFCAWE